MRNSLVRRHLSLKNIGKRKYRFASNIYLLYLMISTLEEILVIQNCTAIK
ncbi:hypothetical protein QCMSULEJ_CDS0015 [Escherichia phage KS_W4]|nr:MAG TPA: hypothetical protein [Caudoviricetes sp.]